MAGGLEAAGNEPAVLAALDGSDGCLAERGFQNPAA
jgi:hypothetical protein